MGLDIPVQKLFQHQTIQELAQHLDASTQTSAPASEIAPFALIFGLGGRVAALGIVGLMAGAATTHVQNGFFMNWFGSLPTGTEGFEYHLLAIGLAATIVFNGSGAFSIDRLLLRYSSGANANAVSSGGLTPVSKRAA